MKLPAAAVRRGFAGLALLLVLSACTELGLDSPPLPADPTSLPVTAAAPSQGATAAQEPTQAPDSTGEDIQVFFTGSQERADAVEAAVADSIAAAQTSVDMAMYNLSLDGVGNALVAAHQRGVRVRVIAESDSLDGTWFKRLRKAGIEVIGDGHESLMHNKFLVIDEQEVWTGSLNLTVSGANDDDNNFVLFRSVSMAARYTREFELMFVDDQFSTQRQSSGEDPRLEVGGAAVEVYFSPEDRPSKRLLELVKSAKKSIRILAYSFTSNSLSQALLDQADAGRAVQGVFDESQSAQNGADYSSLRAAGLDVRLDGNSGLMHNKVIILDDDIVILGSYNFTTSADRDNDENLVIVHSADLARVYTREFQRIYARGQ